MRIPLLKRRGPTATDPVCHMDVPMDNPPGRTLEHNGVTYYFCGPGCNRAFEKEPDAYLSGDKSIDMS